MSKMLKKDKRLDLISIDVNMINDYAKLGCKETVKKLRKRLHKEFSFKPLTSF